MAREIDIYITAKDGFSDAMRKMKQSQQVLSKGVDELTADLKRLSDNKVQLKVDFEKAKSELKSAQKAFRELGDEVSRNNLIDAQTNYENTKRNLDLVTKSARQTQQQIEQTSGAFSKMENRASSSGGSSMLDRIASAGAVQMAGEVLSQGVSTYVSSAFGSDAGTYLGGALSGAASGAAIGTAIAPGIGTAIGAGIGTIAGVIQGGFQVYEKKDDAFKSYVQDSYETVKSEQSAATENGSAIAALREQDLISFSTLLGSEELGKQFLSDLQVKAAETPFQYEDLTAMSKILNTYGFTTESTLSAIDAIGDAGATLGMSAQDMQTVATALGRMRSSNKVDLELMNQMQERGLDVIGYLSEYLNTSKTDVYDMISKGDLTGRGTEIADMLLQSIGADEIYAGGMEKQAATYSGRQSTLEDLQNNLDAAKGEGYNAERGKGIDEEIAFLEGDMKSQMEEAQRMIGQWEASLENQKEQIQRDMLSAVMGGDWGESLADLDEEVAARLEAMSEQYAELQNSDAEDAGAQMGALLAEAKVMAQNEYMASDGYELQKQADLDLIESLRADGSAKESYWNYGYELGQAFSEGRASGAETRAGWMTEYRGKTNGILSYSEAVEAAKKNSNGLYKGYAVGLPYVPYDNYPAMLHEGERVLTASEARGYSSGQAVNVTGNQFVIREEADIEKIAREIARQLELAKITYNGS